MEEICKEFDIKDCTWKELRKKIVEVLESYAGVLEGALQPSTISELHEVSNVDKELLERTHGKLMYFSRFGIEQGLKGNDEEFVQSFWKEWSEIKKNLSEVIGQMKKSWINDKKEENDFAYLG